MTDDKTTTIREQNDLTRKQLLAIHWTRSIPCSVCHTQGIDSYSDEDKHQIYLTVQEFDDFTEDNDPHQEHDFGAFDFKGEKIFWKIDYYAHDLQHRSEDPADLKETMRALTIMLADEY